MELEAEGAPISITLIKPSAIDTPYKEHAKNYLDNVPVNPPPVYSPQTVADTILYCCENPVRDTFVGAGGKILSVMGEYAPGFTDKYMESAMIDSQQTDRPAFTHSFESLYEPGDSRLKERGDYDGHVAQSSLYTAASLHPTITGAVATGAALAFSAGLAYSIMKRNQTH
jgi:hypothetical protein